MPTFRCEYKVTSDLVLGDENKQLNITDTDGIEFRFSNGPDDDDGNAKYLIATVIGNVDTPETAEKQLRSYLAQFLDLLTFSTHSRFIIDEPIRLVEWEADKKERLFRVYNSVDARYPPEPDLIQDFLNSASILDNAQPKPFVRTALKYFRYGTLDKQPEDQYMRFWLSLEILAENIKEADPIPIKCPECHTALTCSACGTEPTRTPMAKQAIENLIERIVGKDWREVSKRQFIVRNGLIHGSSTESVEKKSKVPLTQAVNELARLVWNAIRINITLTDGDASKLVLGHRGGDFVVATLVASAFGSFNHSGDGQHPSDEKIPDVKMTLSTKIKDKIES